MEGPTSIGWVVSFLNRHRELKVTTARPLEYARMAACTLENLESYFEKVKTLFSSGAYSSELVYNIDETMIESTPRNLRAIVPSECELAKFAYHPDNLHITLALCITADGGSLTPLVILPNKEFPADLSEIKGSFCWSGAESGWINAEVFHAWTQKIFLPDVQAKRAKLPHSDCPRRALLFVDGHSSRAQPDMLEELMNNNVDVFCFPSHTSHILQPLDCGVNRIFKTVLRNKRNFKLGAGLPERRLSILTAARRALNAALFEDDVMESFNACGLWPFDPSKVLGTSKVTPPEFHPPPKQTKRSFIAISNRILTDIDLIKELKERQLSRENEEASSLPVEDVIVADQNPAVLDIVEPLLESSVESIEDQSGIEESPVVINGDEETVVRVTATGMRLRDADEHRGRYRGENW